MAEREGASEDALLGGRVRLLQPRSGHRAGTDAVLVAMLAGPGPGGGVVDLGSASGAVGLMLATSLPDARVVLVERDPTLVALARESIALNGLAGRVGVAACDVFGPPAAWRAAWPEAILPLGTAGLVVSNPPFFEAEASRASPDPGRRSAHVMAGGGLAEWVRAASRLLRPGGRLVMIHRADALAACLAALRGFGAIVLRPVHPRAGADASRIVLSACKGARTPLVIRPPLVLHGPDGRFTPEADALHRGVARSASAADPAARPGAGPGPGEVSSGGAGASGCRPPPA